MAKAGARPRPEWEQLPDSGQRIYLALAEGDLERARELYQRDQRAPRPRRRRRGGHATAAAAASAPRPARDLRGFVDRGDRLEPPEMADAEAWKRQQARRDAAGPG
jgi:ketosteroid isomerase-like protein